MFVIFAYDYNDKLMAVPAAFKKENDAWDAIAELMQQQNHPKLAWVEKGVVPYADVSNDSNSGNHT